MENDMAYKQQGPWGGGSGGSGGGGGGGNGSTYGDVNSYGNGAAGASSPGTADQPSYGVIIFAWT